MEILHSPALGDRYLLCELLGSGGMAEVHRARDLRLDRTVAVKVLRPELAADPVQRVRFGREARAAASLNHPGIVAVFDSGEGAGRNFDLPYLVMEYLPGRTLARVLAEDGPLPTRAALRATAEILDALDHAHRHGMVHRDVKPANVMVMEDSTVKLMDFGIARSASGAGSPHGSASAEQTLTAAGMVIGTADYLSPEQARGEAVDARTDLYSVGCLLHELLTGRPPLLADTPLDTIWRRLREDAPPPSLLVPALAPEVDALVCRALAREPADRHATARAMREAVEALLLETEEPGPALSPGAYGPHAPTLIDTVRPVAANDPARPRRGGRSLGRASVAAAVGVVLAACVAGWLAFGGVSGKGGLPGNAGNDVRVPVLTQQGLAHARHALEGLGLHIGHLSVGTCQGSAAAPRTVCAQQPAAGSTLPRGASVDLIVSRPPALAPGS